MTVNIYVGGLSAITETQKRIIEEMQPEDWKPSFTVLSERTGRTVSTVWDNWQRFTEKNDVHIDIRIGESEPIDKRLRDAVNAMIQDLRVELYEEGGREHAKRSMAKTLLEKLLEEVLG